MTPTVRDVLQGFVVAVTSPPSTEAGPEYLAGRAGMLSMLAMLAAQEAERAPAATIAENAAIRALFAEALAYDATLDGALAAAAAERDENLATPALDATNARLRRLVIALHERVEEAGDVEIDRRIVDLYGAMARGRRLLLPGS